MTNNQGKHRPFFRNEFLRFIFSAGSGFLVDITAFYLLYNYVFVSKTYLLLNYAVSSSSLAFTISFFMGVVVNFLITRYLVFAESTLPAGQQFIRFSFVAFVGYFANLWVLHLFIQYVHLYPPVARITAALSLFLASFFVHKLFSFNLSLRHHARTTHSSGH